MVAAVVAVACEMPPAEIEVSDGGRPVRVSVTDNVTLPAGTVLHLQLTGAVASDASRVADGVGARLTQAVVIDGREVVASGSIVTGEVAGADDSGHVTRPAQVSVAFTSLRSAGRTYDIQTSGFSRTVPTTDGGEASRVGVVPGARGQEIRLVAGTDVTTHLTAPLTLPLAN